MGIILFLLRPKQHRNIDEIQKVPQLLDEIKKAIDKQRLIWMKADEKPGKKERLFNPDLSQLLKDERKFKEHYRI